MAHCGHCAKSCRAGSPGVKVNRDHYNPDESATWDEAACPACAQARTLAGRFTGLAHQYRHTTLVAGVLRAAARIVHEYLPDPGVVPAPGDVAFSPPGHRGH